VTTLIVGCGYLGERVGVKLGLARARVFGTVRSEARAASIASLGIQPIIADVLSPASLRALPPVDRVFYCVGFDRASGASMRAVYVDGLTNVLNNLSSDVKRFVYASSTGVYGQSGGEWVDEQTPPSPRSESGKICLEAEERLREWIRDEDRRTSLVVLRFAGLYGPGRVIRSSAIKRGEPISGDPTKLLNVIHIDDAAMAVVAAFEAAAPDPIYVVSDDRPVTRREYYSQVASLLDAPPPVFVSPEPGSMHEGRDATSKRVTNRRMKESLGVKLAYPDILAGLPEALRATSTRS
jgi:nucleoside-diphosphate-sugar epimerase